MKCKKMEEIILTDYIDGNLKGRILEEMEAHLVSCPGCRALAEEAKAAGKLLRSVPKQEAPPEVWHKIRDEISAAPARRFFPEIALENLRYHFLRLRPAVVLVTATALLFFVLTAVRLIPQSNYPATNIVKDDILSISYNTDEEDTAEYDLGTPAEMFFL